MSNEQSYRSRIESPKLPTPESRFDVACVCGILGCACWSEKGMLEVTSSETAETIALLERNAPRTLGMTLVQCTRCFDWLFQETMPDQTAETRTRRICTGPGRNVVQTREWVQPRD